MGQYGLVSHMQTKTRSSFAPIHHHEGLQEGALPCTVELSHENEEDLV